MKKTRIEFDLDESTINKLEQLAKMSGKSVEKTLVEIISPFLQAGVPTPERLQEMNQNCNRKAVFSA